MTRQAPAPPPGARDVAFDVLRRVHADDAYANLALPAALGERRLPARDAAFATELVYGTLRARGSYDAILAACVDRPLEGLDPAVLDVLRLGTHQLLGLRTGAYAAVDASVGLTRRRIGHRATGFVNAVLRAVARRDLADWLTVVAPDRQTDPIGWLAVVHSHPRWIVQVFRDALAGDLDEAAAALAADNERPAVSLAAVPGRCDVEELIALGAIPGRWAPTAATLTGGDPAALAPVRERRARVQDEGSQLVALALAAAEVSSAADGMRWLDVCAGPGGKAALLGGLAGQHAARLLAVERQPHRARLVAGAVGRAADVVVADGTQPAWAGGRFERVLVDVPCSGLGALRRRPEARWRRQPADLDRLRPLQRALLESALDAVRPGGVVGYATCSPHPAETRQVVAAAISGRSDVEWLDARRYLGAMTDLGDGPDVQLWPHRHGTDAMYLALLRTTGS